MASDVAAVYINQRVSPDLRHIHNFTVQCILGSRACSTMLRYEALGLDLNPGVFPLTCLLTSITSKAVRNCASRKLLSSGGVNRKDPLSLSPCMAAVSFLLRSPSPPLLNLQIAAYIMVCFSGFLRYDEACHIYADEVHFYPSHMENFLGKRKNDQIREGSIIVLLKAAHTLALTGYSTLFPQQLTS